MTWPTKVHSSTFGPELLLYERSSNPNIIYFYTILLLLPIAIMGTALGFLAASGGAPVLDTVSAPAAGVVEVME